MVQTDNHNSARLTAFKQGDERAFRYYFNMYHNALCLFALRLIRNEEDTRDIVQNSFISLWEAKATIESELHLRMFLYQSIRHRCINYLKAQKAKTEFLEEYAQLQTDEDYRDRVAEEEVHRLVTQEINELPEEQRKVILLHLEGKNNPEIANLLHVSVNTVKTHKARARQQLMLKLKDLFVISIVLGL